MLLIWLHPAGHRPVSARRPVGHRPQISGKKCRRPSEKKKRRRPNGDWPLSAQSPRDSSRMIARRSSDIYKGKLAGR